MDGEHRYEVEFDLEAYRSFVRAYMRSKGYVWVGYWLACSAVIFFFASMAFKGSAGRFPTYNPFVLLLALILGLLLTATFLWWYWLESMATGSKQTSKRWVCTLTPESWTFTDEGGATTSIPWSTMRLVLTTDDVWLVRYGCKSVGVYRKPLQDAGLEEEFRSRISG